MKGLAVTRHEIARKLGMQTCHVDANELLDLAQHKDWESYGHALDAIERDHGPDYRDLVNELARRQYRMQKRDHRFLNWRGTWLEYKRGDDGPAEQ